MPRLSIRAKIISALLIIGLVSLAAGGVIGFRSGKEALTQSVSRQLVAQREVKRHWIENYVRTQLRFTEAVGSAPLTVAATTALIAAFHDMHAVVAADPAGQKADTAVLEAWYSKSFVPRLDKVAGSHESIEELMPSDPVGRRLQADYIARNPAPVGQKDKMLAAPGGSIYDAVHARTQGPMQRLSRMVGFYDINLMDAATGDIVYAIAKDPDFGSNMYNGAFARSAFSRVAQRALDPKNGGRAVVEDFSAYEPSAFRPQLFTGVPVVADGKTIGVLVAQIDIAALNALLTDDGRWVETGQGQTGEVLMVGEDRLLRSQSRFMVTNPTKFLSEAQAQGLAPSIADQIRTLGTTILYMPDRNAAVEGAFHNRSGLARFLDYRGVEVVSAFGPVDVAGLRWAIEAKQDASEAFAPATRLQRDLLVAAAAAALVLTFVALVCARAFMRPLDRVVAGMASLSSTGTAVSLDLHGHDEFAALGRGYNAMVATIGDRDRQVMAAELKTDELLRSFYPAGLVDRVRSGDSVTGEKIENVTVAVTWIDGLDGLAAKLDAPAMADVLNTMLDAISGAAAGHAVEPIRSLGESHILVCGLSSPQLDHASRTLAWTQSAALAVQRLKTDWASSISLRFGLASGEIDVLLLGRGHAPYDIWGRTLSIARLIAMQAPSGAVQVDESTYMLLTDVTAFQPEAPITTPVLGMLRTWTRQAARPSSFAADTQAGADPQARVDPQVGTEPAGTAA